MPGLDDPLPPTIAPTEQNALWCKNHPLDKTCPQPKSGSKVADWFKQRGHDIASATNTVRQKIDGAHPCEIVDKAAGATGVGTTPANPQDAGKCGKETVSNAGHLAQGADQILQKPGIGTAVGHIIGALPFGGLIKDAIHTGARAQTSYDAHAFSDQFAAGIARGSAFGGARERAQLQAHLSDAAKSGDVRTLQDSVQNSIDSYAAEHPRGPIKPGTTVLISSDRLAAHMIVRGPQGEIVSILDAPINRTATGELLQSDPTRKLKDGVLDQLYKH